MLQIVADSRKMRLPRAIYTELPRIHLPRTRVNSVGPVVVGKGIGECPAALLLEPAALAIPNVTMYNAAMYKRIRVR